MEPARSDLAEVFRLFAAEYLARYATSSQQRGVLKDVVACKTAALGGHKARCDHCGHEQCFYNSCGNRHCPTCQGAARADWLRKRASELLDTTYFHVVFTIPEDLGPLALQNKPVLYGLLFRAASETLLEIARDPKHLGAQIGFLAVLHTWGQRLTHHPHLHCVVPAGGISADRTRWIPARRSFFLSVRVLSRLFRGKFLAYLGAAIRSGEVQFRGRLRRLEDPARLRAFLRRLSHTEWVVYSKRPFAGSRGVLKYLARYTHRVAISNQRIVSVEDGEVTFRYKDYRSGGLERTMTLSGVEFIRRFLQHVLPGSFHRIRYYGFLANRDRTEHLALARRLLAPERARETHGPTPLQEPAEISQVGFDARTPKEPTCPVCKTGRMVVVETIEPRPVADPFPILLDTS